MEPQTQLTDYIGYIISIIGTLISTIAFLYFTLIKDKDRQIRNLEKQLTDQVDWNRGHAEKAVENYKDFSFLLKEVFTAFETGQIKIDNVIRQKMEEVKLHITNELKELGN